MQVQGSAATGTHVACGAVAAAMAADGMTPCAASGSGRPKMGSDRIIGNGSHSSTIASAIPY